MEKPNQEPKPTAKVHWMDSVLERLNRGEEVILVFGALPVQEAIHQIDKPPL